MSVYTSGSATLIAVFGTVSTTANTVVKTINVAATGIDMIDSYVQRAKGNQALRHKLEAHDSQKRLISEVAENRAIREHDLVQRLSSNKALADRYTTIEAELEALLQAA